MCILFNTIAVIKVVCFLLVMLGKGPGSRLSVSPKKEKDKTKLINSGFERRQAVGSWKGRKLLLIAILLCLLQYGNALGMCTDFVHRTIWVFTELAIYQYVINKESR